MARLVLNPYTGELEPDYDSPLEPGGPAGTYGEGSTHYDKPGVPGTPHWTTPIDAPTPPGPGTGGPGGGGPGGPKTGAGDDTSGGGGNRDPKIDPNQLSQDALDRLSQMGPDNPYLAGFSWPTMPALDRLPEQSPFTYPDFVAPTAEDARNAPGYQFAREEGIKALEASKAAQGVLRTGGTLKDILGWGNRFADQNYNNVFNQNATVWNMNRNNAAGNYSLNYNTTRDRLQFNNDATVAEFQPRQRQSELDFNDRYQRWRDELNAIAGIAAAGAGA